MWEGACLKLTFLSFRKPIIMPSRLPVISPPHYRFISFLLPCQQYKILCICVSGTRTYLKPTLLFFRQPVIVPSRFLVISPPHYRLISFLWSCHHYKLLCICVSGTRTCLKLTLLSSRQPVIMSSCLPFASSPYLSPFLGSCQ